MEDEDCGLIINDFMKVESIKLPIVMIGEKSAISNNLDVFTVPANLNVRRLVRTVAQILKVTAKEMASKNVGQLYPIPIGIFRNLERSFCDSLRQNDKI